jgi:antitoxin VapB
MGMNIKSEKAHRLAKQLANSTGESMTAVVEQALEEKLSRLNRDLEKEWRYQRLREIVAQMPPIPQGVTSDHSDLYDEDGLPA